MKLEEVNTRTKEAVDFLVTALESGHSEVLTAYLGAMAKFHTYSFGNIMLIARQKPDATNVAGLRTWNSLGRFVKRGEKGIFILAPMVGRRSTKDVATDEPSEDATTEGQRTLYGFRAVYIFDISQTEGKELPTLTEVNGDVSGYRERLFKFVESQSVEISFSERISPAKGLSYGGKITLLAGMQPAEEISTLVHEIADLCGARLGNAPKDTLFGVDKRHITFRSETAKELHDAWVLAPHLSLVPFPAGVTGRQRLRFHLKIDFGVDIGGVDGNVSQPRPDCVDVYAST